MFDRENKGKNSNTLKGMLQRQLEKEKRAEEKRLKEEKRNLAFLKKVEKNAKPKEPKVKKGKLAYA